MKGRRVFKYEDSLGSSWDKDHQSPGHDSPGHDSMVLYVAALCYVHPHTSHLLG